MTRRELTQAVVEAARVYAGRNPDCSLNPQGQVVARAVRALEACTEPDLDALDAAVAQAVDEYREKAPSVFRTPPRTPEVRSHWEKVVAATDARRAALKPKPRYRVLTVYPTYHGPFVAVHDTRDGRDLTADEVFTLLNEKEAAK
jgi:hypothetical protein